MKTCVNCGLRTEPQTADKESSCKCDLPLVEGEDFYYENGLMVFTEKYHIKKGYCCNSGCRHCPWENG